MRIEQGTLTREITPEGVKITFLTKDYQETDQLFAQDLKHAYIADFRRLRRRRSRNANAYMWVLVDRIAEAMRLGREEVYRRAIKEAGVASPMPVPMLERAVPVFVRDWAERGTGYFCEVEDSKLKGYKNVRIYYGSSRYTSKEMSRLLDYIVQEAKDIGIQTETPEEIERMKREWEATP